MKCISTIFLSCLFFLSSQAADNNDTLYTQSVWTNIRDDAQHLIDVSYGLLMTPLKSSQKAWQNKAYLSAANGVLFLTDIPVKKWAISNQNSFNNVVFSIDDYLNGTTGNYAGTTLYFTGLITGNEKIRQMGLHAVASIFFAKSITGTLKFILGRKRPWAGTDNMDFKIFRGSRNRYRSLPSGHTTGAFAFATVMAKSFNSSFWKIVWYGGAAAVAAARVYNNNHWLSDTFAGAIIGYGIADYVVNFENDSKIDESDLTLKFQPSLGSSGLIIRIIYRMN